MRSRCVLLAANRGCARFSSREDLIHRFLTTRSHIHVGAAYSGMNYLVQG